jgi:hypothetical protein
MASKVKSRQVTLIASNPVEIEPGITLPAGRYHGTEKQLGIALMGGMSWTKPDYKMELTASQLEAMGAKPSTSLISIEFGISRFVRSGELTVV